MGNLIPQNAAAFFRFAQGILRVVDDRMGYTISGPDVSLGNSTDQEQATQPKSRRPGSEIWTHIPETAYRELRELINNFGTVLDVTPVDSTRAQIERRNIAKRKCESFLRYFIRFYLRNPVVTNDDLIEMGIPPIDNIRTVHKQVNETVDFVFHIRGTNNVIVDFWQTGHTSKARPKGYSGAVIIWALSEEEPANNEAYPFHTLATRTPYTIEFDNHDSGKRVWVKICWQNARGILGRFSEAKSAMVP